MYDLIVIGGGIVGLATAWRYTQTHPGRDVLLLEKESGACTHQSGRNSGVLHSGIYYAPGSRKARLCRLGKQRMEEFCSRTGVPFERCGKLIIATNSAQLEPLAELERRGASNGVATVRLDSRALQRIEPEARGVSALHVPETAIVDFAHVGAALVAELERAGAELRFDTRVLQIRCEADGARVALEAESLVARNVIVCAGLQSDRLAQAAGLAKDVRVIPFRGEYRALNEPHAEAVRGLIYPVPDARFPFLGVHLTRRIDGKVDAGPNAVLAWSREGRGRFQFNCRDTWQALTWPGLWRLLRNHPGLAWHEYSGSIFPALFAARAQQLLPALRRDWLTAAPAGVRAQLLDRKGNLVDDFAFARDGAVLHLLNAPSPAATSSLAIAEVMLAELKLGESPN